MKAMKLGASLVAALMVSLAARSASAALTSSEKGQIRDFVAGARSDNAARVRSLVARTDLTAEETAASLSDAVAPVPFNEARGVFLRELVFGASSAPSRPLLAHATVKAMLARADAVYQKYVGGLDHEPKAIAELAAIYAWLDAAIANAGRPTLTAHDASAGISAAAYEASARDLRDHIDKNSRWLKGDAAVPESIGRVRAQAQIAFVDMLPDGLTRRVDAADRLGLKGARRTMLADWGILLQDAGKLDDKRAELVRVALTRLPGARVDVQLIYAGEVFTGPIRTRGLVAYASGASAAEANPFGEELTAVTVDTGMSAIVQDLAVLAAKRALDNRGELRLQAERDAAAAQSDAGRLLGKPRAPSVDHVIGAAAHLLVLDAPRTVDLAFVRLLGRRPESAAILSDAIGALAAFAVAAADPKNKAEAPAGPALELGKSGGTAATTLTAIRLAPNGAAIGFTLDGHVWAIDRSTPTSAVTGVTRDGQLVALAHLPTARAAKK